jgi:carbon monoxide dehydrogenase subunit G
VPAATFTREITVTADPTRCWAVLTDVPRLVDWVTILDDAKELTHLDRYAAVLADRLGPFKLRAELDIAVSEVEEGKRIRVRANGEDRQVASRIGVDAVLELRAQDDGSTVIGVDGTYEVIGRVATLGAGMIRTKANKIMDDFFTRATKELGAA